MIIQSKQHHWRDDLGAEKLKIEAKNELNKYS
jgi:hypothetical protein